MYGREANGSWSPAEWFLHIYVLELRAVRLALRRFHVRLAGKSVALLMANTAALSYVRNCGGPSSVSLLSEVRRVLLLRGPGGSIFFQRSSRGFSTWLRIASAARG